MSDSQHTPGSEMAEEITRLRGLVASVSEFLDETITACKDPNNHAEVRLLSVVLHIELNRIRKEMSE